MSLEQVHAVEVAATGGQACCLHHDHLTGTHLGPLMRMVISLRSQRYPDVDDERHQPVHVHLSSPQAVYQPPQTGSQESRLILLEDLITMQVPKFYWEAIR